MDIVEQLSRLADLHHSGALSSDEYARAKARLLSDSGEPSTNEPVAEAPSSLGSASVDGEPSSDDPAADAAVVTAVLSALAAESPLTTSTLISRTHRSREQVETALSHLMKGGAVEAVAGGLYRPATNQSESVESAAQSTDTASDDPADVTSLQGVEDLRVNEAAENDSRNTALGGAIPDEAVGGGVIIALVILGLILWNTVGPGGKTVGESAPPPSLAVRVTEYECFPDGCMASIQARNTGSEATRVSATDFKLVDTSGQRFDAEYNDELSGQLNPGAAAAAVLWWPGAANPSHLEVTNVFGQNGIKVRLPN